MIAVNAIAAIAGVYFLRRRRSPSRGYVHLLAAAQTSVRAAAIGLLLLSNGPSSRPIHYLYGGVALAAILSPWIYAPSPTKRVLWFTGATLAASALGARGYLTGS